MAQVASQIGTDLFTLRLELIDDWSVQQFEKILFQIRKSYGQIGRLSAYVSSQSREGPAMNRPPFLRLENFSPDVPLKDIYQFSGITLSTLRIRRIDLASPGLVDIIGSLNPLKVIAEFISSYRAENTKRAEIHTNTLLKREELRSQFALRVLELIPESIREEYTDRFVEIAQTVIDPAFASLERVAVNPKVERVYLLEDETGGDIR